MVNKILRYLIYSILIVLYLIAGFNAFKYPFWEERNYTKCGVVTQTLNTERAMKYKMTDDFYIGVKYDDGTFVGEEVGVTTFMSKKVGDRICLNKRKWNYKMDLSDIFFIINGLVIFFGGLYYLIEVRKIFNNEQY